MVNSIGSEARAQMVQVVATVIMLIATGQCPAQSPPAEIAKVPIVDETLPKKPAVGLSLGGLQIVFEESQLLHIGMLTNNVVLHHSVAKPDPHSGSTWLCYTLIEGPRRTRLWLISDDEFGGSKDNFITGIYAATMTPTDRATADCPDRSSHFKTVRFDNGIWLGASLQDIKAALGTSPPQANGWWRYEHVGKDVVTTQGKSQEFDVNSRFDVKLSRGRVVEIRASQFSTT